MKNLKLLLAVVTIGAVTTFTSCSDDDDSGSGSTGGGNNNVSNTAKISTGVWGIDSIQFTDQATPPTTITLPDSVFDSHTWGLNFASDGNVALSGTSTSFNAGTYVWTFNTAETVATVDFSVVTVPFAWSDANKTLVGSWGGVLIIGSTQIPGTFTEHWGQ